jgi:hypothetical protein
MAVVEAILALVFGNPNEFSGKEAPQMQNAVRWAAPAKHGGIQDDERSFAENSASAALRLLIGIGRYKNRLLARAFSQSIKGKPTTNPNFKKRAAY